MKRTFFVFLYSLCGSIVVIALSVVTSPTLSFRDVSSIFASVFFTESITPEQLKNTYANALQGGKKVRVLIVPGHDSEVWGTEFHGIREADMTVMVGEELTKFLSADPAFEPLLVRGKGGYAEGFEEYADTEKANIRAFIAEKKQTMQELVRAGSVHLTDGVIHNSAPTEVATRLYAFNKWANQHGVDIVLHLHFNDYPGRAFTRPGRYNGFAIYVPDPQFSNARASRAVAKSLFDQFSGFYAASNLPIEDSGIVEDQSLIAIGSYNTLDPAGLLIEYGYIYEPKFLDDEIRKRVTKELAFQTYRGLNRFFGKYGELFQKYPTTLLPYRWQESLGKGIINHPDVLSLQAALLFENLYPPEGESKRDCPITGSFGPCTARSVALFQEKNGILPVTGVVGEQTVQRLNEKYGR